MADLTALEKFSCPACGAQAEWNVRKQLLVCPFCGTQSPAELASDTGLVQELDLATALRDIPDQDRGWKIERRTVQCRSCKAVTVFSPEEVAQRCDFCGSPELIAYEELRSPIRPGSVLPFSIDREKVQAIVRRWLGSRWFAPNNLRKHGLIDLVHGLYIPYWTFDSQVDCPWTAQSGRYYYVSESYTDSQGRRQTRRVRKIRWSPSSGAIQHTFDDVLVPGSRGIELPILRAIEPFPTKDLVPYDPGYVSGWHVEHYQVVLFDAARLAREQKMATLRALCAREVPGDTHRNLQIAPIFTAETFKHILVPVWLIAYDYGRKRNQIVINGVTGSISGRYPKSAWKIFFLVLAIVAVLLVIFLVGASR
ncbi:MAG TPA: zinc ribbon domain-containing protein [Verrucomicrobiales bacterium]|nr:zinc ribbon domain-containing protein [Verrucomicrobiales bacterium]